MIKNYFRILKKTHAYLQTILKTPVKFQKDWTETVGGVKGTKYLLKTRNHAPRATPHGKPKTVSLHFSSKRRGTKKKQKKKHYTHTHKDMDYKYTCMLRNKVLNSFIIFLNLVIPPQAYFLEFQSGLKRNIILYVFLYKT